jgi:NAD-dependent SIR2 family protein deacetylase
MIEPLVDLLRDRRTVVLAGAGCSTESGIPDYRGPQGRLRTRKPVQYGEFVRSEANRRRYWARSAVGWRRVADATPNPAHHGLASLEGRGLVGGVITQNVDGLHHAAGSRRVIELHGSLAHVVCLSCGDRTTRLEMQERLECVNRAWIEDVASGRARGGSAESAPDGDAELPDDVYDGFEVPVCRACGGVLKPDVVFFGENVPKERVAECWALVDDAEALLVVGSSLTVYSGRRFIYGAAERALPIGVVNLGPTRADDYAAVKLEGRLGEVIPRLAGALGAA